jgi:hypothetical protein
LAGGRSTDAGRAAGAFAATAFLGGAGFLAALGTGFLTGTLAGFFAGALAAGFFFGAAALRDLAGFLAGAFLTAGFRAGAFFFPPFGEGLIDSLRGSGRPAQGDNGATV